MRSEKEFNARQAEGKRRRRERRRRRRSRRRRSRRRRRRRRRSEESKDQNLRWKFNKSAKIGEAAA